MKLKQKRKEKKNEEHKFRRINYNKFCISYLVLEIMIKKKTNNNEKTKQPTKI